jgi:hypothetical protein
MPQSPCNKLEWNTNTIPYCKPYKQHIQQGMLPPQQANTEPTASVLHAHMQKNIQKQPHPTHQADVLCGSRTLELQNPRGSFFFGTRTLQYDVGALWAQRATKIDTQHAHCKKSSPERQTLRAQFLSPPSRANQPSQRSASTPRRALGDEGLSTATDDFWTDYVCHISTSSRASSNVPCGQRLGCLQFCVVHYVFREAQDTTHVRHTYKQYGIDPPDAVPDSAYCQFLVVEIAINLKLD